jgi:hypothetical protein
LTKPEALATIALVTLPKPISAQKQRYRCGAWIEYWRRGKVGIFSKLLKQICSVEAETSPQTAGSSVNFLPSVYF